MEKANPEVNIDEILKEIDKVSIILYNDDVNTFQFVSHCLVKYCGHSMIQAEQCAHIVHNNGKCQIKHGTYEDLEVIYYALSNAELTVQIE